MGYLDHFNFEIFGPSHGEKLVFLHGLLGSGANWRRITKRFQDKYQILVYDQRGHGKSFQPLTGYSPLDYATDLQKILDELAWEKVYLVGHSMGGRNAMQFASLFPHRTIKLVIEDIGPDHNVEAREKIERLLALVPTPFATRQQAKDFLLEKFPQLLRGNSQAMTLANYFYSNIVEKAEGVVDWRFSKEGVLASLHEGRSRDYWQLWESISTPTLLIRGEKSDELSPEVYREMLQRNAHCQGVEIKNSGHWVHFDEPDQFSDVVWNFFNEALTN